LRPLGGEPKDYLLENYAFPNGMTVRDSEFGFLEEDYLCIDVTKETYTVNDAYINRYRNTFWEGQHYGSSFGKLFFADGTELKRPENTDKIIP
jgi:hypothetical protein